jgi:chromosome segregation ATPase
MTDDRVYLETLKELKNMKEEMHKEISRMKAEMDIMYIELQRAKQGISSIREIQEEVAKLAGVPVGMLFVHYRG